MYSDSDLTIEADDENGMRSEQNSRISEAADRSSRTGSG
jgi:hypothetical protein